MRPYKYDNEKDKLLTEIELLSDIHLMPNDDTKTLRIHLKEIHKKISELKKLQKKT